MNKRILLILLSLLLLANIVESVHIDDEVGERLNSDEEVSVIVILRDEPFQEQRPIGALSAKSISGEGMPKQNLERKKAMIKDQQDKVLSGLDIAGDEKLSVSSDADLKLGHRYSTFNGFSGKLTQKGLEKYYVKPYKEKRIIFKECNIDQDSLTVQKYKIFWSALGFEKFSPKKNEFKEIESVWEFCEEEKKFLLNFKKELDQFMGASKKDKPRTNTQSKESK